MGAGGLSRAVHDLGCGLIDVVSQPGSVISKVDVALDSDFEVILDTLAHWKHLAPPCKSLTKCRRTDQFASVKVLRSDARPEGFGCKMTKEANKLVERSVEVARQQWEMGFFFSIENPLESFIWEMRCMKALLKLHGVRLLRVDQCAFGSPHKKPTGIVTNAPFLSEGLCDIQTRPHRHVPLIGFVKDFRWEGATDCFYTELAAEYPEGLCNAWASSALTWVSTHKVPSALMIASTSSTASLDSTSVRTASAGILGTLITSGQFKSVLASSMSDNPVAGPLRRGAKLTTAKEAREKQSNECVGGLRNPNSAVAKSHSLRATGLKIRTVLNELVSEEENFSEAKSVIDTLGKPDCHGFSETLILKARVALAERFGAAFPEPGIGVGRSMFQSNLWEAILADAKDPEVHIVDWMRHGCPTGGFGSPIGTCGIFPLAPSCSSAVESSKTFAMMQENAEWDEGSHSNYKSFYVEGGSHADAEVTRIKERNFIEIFTDWAAVVAQWPLARASKVALIIKQRLDLSLKLRFIVDLLRSGVNGEAVIPERVVLPRIIDYANCIVDLLESQQAGTKVELYTLDFADAFYTIWLRQADRGSLVFKVSHGWAVFNRLCFGMAGAALIWGRLAAAACRIGQATFKPDELRLQCYVDDPAIAVLGSQHTRDKLIIILLLLWAALGLEFSWAKGNRGPAVPWIGATFTLDKRAHQGGGATLFPGVAVTIQQAKFAELRQSIEEIYNANGLIPMKKVLRVAGQLAWAGGLFPWIRGFNACLWAAITDHERSQPNVHKLSTKVSFKKRPTHLMFVKRISQAVSWTRLLMAGLIRDQDGVPVVMARWFSVAHRLQDLQVCIRTDASPFGMGAILFKKGIPVFWLALDWSPDDLHFLKATVGDPAWQAEWELFAILIAIDTWLPHLRGQAAFLLQADATAALFAAARLAGRTTAMNAIAVEIAIRLESAQVCLSPEHFRGTLNFECDALSRLAQGAAIPASLASVPRSLPKPRARHFFWAVLNDTLME